MLDVYDDLDGALSEEIDEIDEIKELTLRAGLNTVKKQSSNARSNKLSPMKSGSMTMKSKSMVDADWTHIATKVANDSALDTNEDLSRASAGAFDTNMI